MAALVLVRFLVALPVGAVARRLPHPPAARRRGHRGRHGVRGGRLRADVHLGPRALEHASATLPLVSAASASGSPWRRSTPPCWPAPTDDVHGLATATVVVARMVGMLVGISALTTIGLRRYYAEQADVPSVQRGLRRQEPLHGVHLLLKEAGIAQEHTVFLGAAVCAVIAGVLALVLFRPRRHAGPRHGHPPARRRLTTTLGPRGDPVTSADDVRPGVRRPARRQRGVRRHFDERRLRRHRARRRGHRDLHGLPHRPAPHARPPPRRRQDLPQPRWPGHAAGARGAGARRAPPQRRPDPRHPPHPLRDDRAHRAGAARAREPSAGQDAAWQQFSVVEDQMAASTRTWRRSTPTRSSRTPSGSRRGGMDGAVHRLASAARARRFSGGRHRAVARHRRPQTAAALVIRIARPRQCVAAVGRLRRPAPVGFGLSEPGRGAIRGIHST